MKEQKQLNYEDIWINANYVAKDWLININDKRRSYISKQQQFTEISVALSDGQSRGRNHGQPTERKGMQLADIDLMHQWVITIEMVESMLSPKKLVFLQFRREAELTCGKAPGRPAWVEYVMANLINSHGIEADRKTLFAWQNELVELTVRVAIKRGLL